MCKPAEDEMTNHNTLLPTHGESTPFERELPVSSRTCAMDLPDSVGDTSNLDTAREHDKTPSDVDCHAYHDEMLIDILRDEYEDDCERIEAQRDFQLRKATDDEEEFRESWTEFDDLQEEWFDDRDSRDEMYTSIMRDAYLEDDMRMEALQDEHEFDDYYEESMHLDSLQDEHDYEGYEQQEFSEDDLNMIEEPPHEYTDNDEDTDDERDRNHYEMAEEIEWLIHHEPPEFDAEAGVWNQPEQWFSEEFVRQWKSVAEHNPTLCGMCRSHYRDSLLRRSQHGKGLTFQLQISPLRSQNADCGLCKFLSKMLIASSTPGISSDGSGMFTLRVYKPAMHSYPRRMGRTTVLLVTDDDDSTLALCSLHFKAPHRQWLPPTTDPESVDYESLRRIVTRCSSGHGPSCQEVLGDQLPSLKVIDCNSGKVVPAPKQCRYVALSYVWGDGYSEPRQDSKTYSYPQTIADSILVTTEMGYRYLWVDNYCIDQKNKLKKQEIIQNMDDIYSRAQLTIIAAAGSDPSYGLPGVGTQRRDIDHQLDLNKFRLSQVMRPGFDFPKSRWWGRGWTYQEGVLSKRKLIFTDHRVFFVCNEMHAFESLDMRDSEVRSANNGLFNELRLPTGRRSYETYLEDYSRRALTHQADALSACLGILKATNTRHIWGVPIVQEAGSGYFTLALCWRHNGTTTIREGFPSWSWTGWNGGSTFLDSMATGLPLKIDLLCSDNGDDSTTSWALVDYRRNSRAERYAGKASAPRILQLTGFALDASWLHSCWPDDMSDFCITLADQQTDTLKPNIVLDFDGLSALATLSLDQEMTTEQLRDVIAMGVRSTGYHPCITALLLRPDGEHYTRIGLIDLQCHGSACPQYDGSHAFWNQRARRQTVTIR